MTYTLTFDPTGWLEINYLDADKTLQSTSYHPTQLDLIQADCTKHSVTIEGVDAEAIAKWVADYVPPSPVVLTPEQQLAQAKAARAALVDAITVTTTSGKIFDGNEDAQRRMTSAITAMEEVDTIPWILVNNSMAVVTRAELREALRLSGAAMSAIWVAPYTIGN